MRTPLLHRISAGDATPINESDWPAAVDAALTGDPAAVQRVFAAGARWANRLIHSRPWLDDPESEVVALMWTTLTMRPPSSDRWRTLVSRRLRVARLRPSREYPHDWTVEPAATRLGAVEDPAVRTIARLDAVEAWAELGPLPDGVRRWAGAVLCDTRPDRRAAKAMYDWRHRRLRKAAA